MWLITCEPHDLATVRTALEEAGIPIDNASLSLLPKTQVEVDADQARTLLRMVDLLEESDDVQDVYFNFDIPDAVLADA
jgi:transcriptional/translational regulatory protein YebC/TACO1